MGKIRCGRSMFIDFHIAMATFFFLPGSVFRKWKIPFKMKKSYFSFCDFMFLVHAGVPLAFLITLRSISALSISLEIQE